MVTLDRGIHADVPMETYLSDCTPGPGVQATNLRHLFDRCPAYAFARWAGNPARVEEDGTEATAFGTAAHTFIVEGRDAFDARYAVKPAGLRLSTKAGIAWKEDHAGMEHIDTDDLDALERMAAMINAHPVARLALRNGIAEQTAVVQDKETGLWLKCRPDYLTPRLAINLKTTVNNGAEAFALQAWKLRYHVSAAMTLDILTALDHPALYAFLSVEKTPPYVPALRALSDRFLVAGRLIYRRALRRFADCLASNRWPGYSDEVETIGVNAWQDREIDLLIESEDAPQKEAA